MSTNAPLATLASSSQVINCSALGSGCEWSSPSVMDRSDPNSTKVCPATKSVRVWRDRTNENRKFKCVSNTTTNSAQTGNCHISELGKPAAGWPADKPYATGLNDNCKNVWYRY
jgi:hypothetical protein